MERLTTYRPPLPRDKAVQPGQLTQPTQTGRCPFLGTETDPGTALAFPSDANHCFRTRLPVPVSLIHQETYCLSTRYTSCPVYRQNVFISPDMEIGPAAAVMASGGVIGGTMSGMMNGGMSETMVGETAAATPAPRQRRAFNLTSLLILVVMLGLAFLAWQSWRGYLAAPNPAAQATVGVEQVDPPVIAPVIPPTPLVTGEVTVGAGAVEEASATPSPSPAATLSTDKSPDLGSGLLGGETPTASAPAGTSATPEGECGPPQWWVRVVVETGDTAESLAAARGITAAELLHANCLEAATELTPGRTIFLPPLGVIVTLQPPPTFPASGGSGQPFPTLPFPTVFVPTALPLPTSTPLPPGPTDTPESRPSRPPNTVPPPTATSPPTGIPPATITPLPTSAPPREPTLPPTSTPPSDVGSTNTPQPTPTATVMPTKTPPGGL